VVDGLGPQNHNSDQHGPQGLQVSCAGTTHGF
jgi:hypothetical protein